MSGRGSGLCQTIYTTDINYTLKFVFSSSTLSSMLLEIRMHWNIHIWSIRWNIHMWQSRLDANIRPIFRNRFFDIFWHTARLRLSLHHVLEQNAFTTELLSIEVGKVHLVCLLREFMNINEASKMAIRDLAQWKLRRFLATSSVTSARLSMLVSWVFLKYLGAWHVV